MSSSTVQASLASIPQASGLAAVMASAGSLGVGKPFANPICLIERTHVAGTSHIEDIGRRADDLESGDRLTFKRDKGNAHDKWAVMVMNPKGERIGFLSCDVNEIPARLMDGGKELYAKVLGSEYKGSWLKIDMEVYLDD